MRLLQKAKPTRLSVDQDFFSNVFNFLQFDGLFCDSYFFLFRVGLDQHSVKICNRKRKISGLYNGQYTCGQDSCVGYTHIYWTKSEMDFSTG